MTIQGTRHAAIVAAALVFFGACSQDKSKVDKRSNAEAIPSTAANTESPAPPKRESLVVGALYWSMNIPGQVAMREGLEQSLIDINIVRQNEKLPQIKLKPFVAGDGDEGIENQVRQMNALVVEGVDLIIAQPTDTAALSAALQAANTKGIPVIAYDQQILQGKLASFITSDNYQAGYLDGEYVAASFSDSKKLKIVVVQYPQVSSTVSRVDGFIDALQTNGQAFEVVKSYSAVEPVAGAAAGKAIVADFPKPGSIDVVFTVNDGGGLSVFHELRQAGRTEIFGATVDGDPAS
ncbi:MAG: sugar ABC transporter substrate-binding protein, partial [Kofleriaceae bacterium]|nr:sugar ABC transporter substrate-binding protein [Kofleriaceae bacterium]